jgi:hypothetical protein
VLDCLRIAPATATDLSIDGEIYCSGKRHLVELAPDGGAPNFLPEVHGWFPMPLRKSGDYIVYSVTINYGWISGIAFGKNLWGAAKNSAFAYTEAVNGGDNAIMVGYWNSD